VDKSYNEVYYKPETRKRDRGSLAQEINWRSVYDERNKEKITAKYLFYNILLSKFYLNQTNITVKKEKNLIQE